MFFAYIGFDAISTAAEETQNPQRNLPIGILGGLGDLHVDLRRRRRRADRHGAVHRAGGRRSAGARARARRASRRSAGSSRSAPRCRCRRCCSCFQYGQPRIFFAMARDGLLPQWAAQHRSRTRASRAATTLITGVFVALVVADRRRGGDLRPDEHRHAVRVHARQHRRAGAALQGAGSPAAVQGAVRVAGLHRCRRPAASSSWRGCRARRGSGSVCGW